MPDALEKLANQARQGNERGIDFVIRIITRREIFGPSGSDNRFDKPEMCNSERQKRPSGRQNDPRGTTFCGEVICIFQGLVCGLGNSVRRAIKASQGNEDRSARRKAGGRLHAVAAVLLTLTATMPPGYAQETGAGAKGPDKAASQLPPAPEPDAHTAHPAAHFEPRLLRGPSRRGLATRLRFICRPRFRRRASSIRCGSTTW